MNLASKPISMNDFKSDERDYMVYDQYYDSIIRPYIDKLNYLMGLKDYAKYNLSVTRHYSIRFYAEYVYPMGDLVRPSVRQLQLIKKFPEHISIGGVRYDPV